MSHREYPDHPRVGVGAVVLREGRLLLVRRGAAPAKGLWAIPGGGLRLGETLQAGAEREILEETGMVIRAGAPVFTCDSFEKDGAGRIRFHYVIVDVTADYVSGDVKGAELSVFKLLLELCPVSDRLGHPVEGEGEPIVRFSAADVRFQQPVMVSIPASGRKE